MFKMMDSALKMLSSDLVIIKCHLCLMELPVPPIATMTPFLNQKSTSLRGNSPLSLQIITELRHFRMQFGRTS